jgi:hypothetical protein
MYIFCASPGRSGTRFFAEMFKYFTDIPSFHEPLPKCVNNVCIENNSDNTLSNKTREILYKKCQRIIQASKNDWYFESNHMFIKSFSSFVLPFIDHKVGCIYIERPITDYLISYTRRGKRDKWPLDFQVHPEYDKSLLCMPQSAYSFYELITWNWFEVKTRYLEFKQRGIYDKAYEFDFRKINDITEWQKLFAHFEVPLKRKVDKIPDDLYRHQSGYTEEMIPSILKHIRDNWKTPGDPQLFPTDMEQLANEAKK